MKQYGVLVISHGSRDARWVMLVEEAVAQMRLPPQTPRQCAFLELVAGRSIQDGIDRLEACGVTDIIVIPLFISSGSVHIAEIGQALGVAREYRTAHSELADFRLQSRIHWCEPMDDSEETVHILLELAQELSERPDKELLMIVAHGNREAGFHRRSRQVLQSVVRQVRCLGTFAAVDYAMLQPDQTGCKIKAWLRKHPQLNCIVIPFFLSEGYFTRVLIPSRLEGFTCRYHGRAVLPHPLVTRWMEKRAEVLMSDLG